MAEMLVVKSKIKELVQNMNVGGDVADALNELALQQVALAKKRAEANGRKTLQARDLYLGKVSADAMLVVKSKIKDVSGEFNVGGDFADALNEMLAWSVAQGSMRAEANGRKTVQARDL